MYVTQPKREMLILDEIHKRAINSLNVDFVDSESQDNMWKHVDKS